MSEAGTCPICGNVNANRPFIAREMMFGSGQEFLYYECALCGCLWIANVPENLSRHYSDGYYSLNESAFRMFVRRHPALYRLARYATARGELRLPEWWPSAQMSKDARVLDVGAGVGRLLLRLNALGYQNLLGIDPFVEGDTRIPDGPAILKKSIEDTTGQFDVVVMDHSLEHISDPKLVFRELKRLLAPSGVAIIRTPLASSQAWREYGADWVQLDAPRHLVVHTVKSIEILSRATGLSVESLTYDSTAFQYWGSEQYRRGISLGDPRSYLLSARKSIFTRQEIDEFTQRARKLNSRGAGDQACFYLCHLTSS